MESLAFNHICLLFFFVSGCVADDHSPDISSAAYFGCYSDIGDHATFIKPLQNMTNLTPDACRRRCNNEDCSFAGLWGGTNCWCADTNPDKTMNLRKLDNSKCNKTCSGNSSISCGGLSDVLRNHIYSVYSVCPKTWFGPRCTERCNCKNRIHCSIHGVCPDNQCASGWKLEIKLNRPRCQADVDECSANISRCGDICTNSVGSYECRCRTGYELRSDKHTCSDIDECSDESSCAHLCNNTVGSFICSCFSGFTRNESDQRRCIDINECSINNGDCNETCSNTDGGYYCSCPFGYKLQDDKQSCQEGPLLLILSFIKRHYIYILSAIAGLILILVIGLCIKNKRSAKEKCSVGSKFDLIASTGREDETTTETAEVVLYSSVNGIKETGHRNEYTSGNDDSTSEEMGGSYVSMDGVEEPYYLNANERPDGATTAGVMEVLYSSVNRVGETDDDNVIYQDVR